MLSQNLVTLKHIGIYSRKICKDIFFKLFWSLIVYSNSSITILKHGERLGEYKYLLYGIMN